MVQPYRVKVLFRGIAYTILNPKYVYTSIFVRKTDPSKLFTTKKW